MRPLVAKEIRALMPAWIATLSAIGIAILIDPLDHTLGLVAYGFGSIALGAQSVGHEYTYRTLTMLLSQPSSRARLLLAKLGVLTAMVLTLAIVARLALLKPGESAWVIASILCALLVAPLLAMLCRSALAGVVFAGAAPVWASAFSEVVSAAVLWGVTLGLCIPAAIVSWRLFMRLEAIDGRGSDLELPRIFHREPGTAAAASVDGARPRRPLWQLVKKELYLQQLTFAVAGVWLVIWMAVSALAPLVPGLAMFPVGAVGIFNGGLIALLIGSLASAEERRIGTLEWQVLLPPAAWAQWAVKVGTALGLAAMLSFALPVALADGHLSFSGGHAGVIVALTTVSLYVSSLCRTPVRALMICGPLLLALSELLLYAEGASHGALAALPVPAAAVLVLMLTFALENHRSAGQTAGRVSRQVTWMAGCLGLSLALAKALGYYAFHSG